MANILKWVLNNFPNKDYFFSTHFWGPLANWGFVIAVNFIFFKKIDHNY